MKIISVRETPKYKDAAIKYFQDTWANENSRLVYEDCISNSIGTKAPLPQWYLLYNGNKIAGCAGLITNDFISRMDLYPWICALYIEEAERGHAYSAKLLEKAKQDAAKAGFKSVYLCTDHTEYYEHYGFTYIADGYHPWGESSRIYKASLL